MESSGALSISTPKTQRWKQKPFDSVQKLFSSVSQLFQP